MHELVRQVPLGVFEYNFRKGKKKKKIKVSFSAKNVVHVQSLLKLLISPHIAPFNSELFKITGKVSFWLQSIDCFSVRT